MIRKILEKFKSGFSLMEILIWVTIMSVFVGLIGISSLKIMDNAKIQAAKQELNLFSAVLLDYYETEGTFPSDDQGLNILLEQGYITKDSKKLLDPWRTQYVYTSINNGEGYIIKSLGADKKEGGDKKNKKDIIVSSGNIEDDYEEDTEDSTEYDLYQ